MGPDDDVCYCHHVPLRKLVAFAKRERPRHPSQMSECLGAGTGCGWCIPYLCRIQAAALRGEELSIEMTPEEYAAARAAYRGEKRPRHEFSDGEQRPVAPTAPGAQTAPRSSSGSTSQRPDSRSHRES